MNHGAARNHRTRLVAWLALAACSLAICLLWVEGAHGRTWTDSRGRKVNGKFVRVDGDKVIILSGGKLVTPKLANLSQADQDYVRDVLEGKKPADADDDPASDPVPSGSAATPPTTEDENPFETISKPAAVGPGQSTDLESGSDDSDDSRSTDSRSTDSRSSPGRPVKSDAVMRDWSTPRGPVRAKFVRYFDGNVVLMRSGKVEQHSFWSLSEDDQQYVRDLLAAKGLPDAIPDSPPLSLGKSEEAGVAGGSSGGSPVGAGSPLGGFGPGMVGPGIGGPPGMGGPGMGRSGLGGPGGMGPRIGGPMGGPTGIGGGGGLSGPPFGPLGSGIGGPGIGGPTIPGPGAMPGAPMTGMGPGIGGPPALGASPLGGMNDPFARVGPIGASSTPLTPEFPAPSIEIREVPIYQPPPLQVEETYDEPSDAQMAGAIMIVVLSIACPLIVFVAFVGFMIWLIIKLTSRPSYPQPY